MVSHSPLDRWRVRLVGSVQFQFSQHAVGRGSNCSLSYSYAHTDFTVLLVECWGSIRDCAALYFMFVLAVVLLVSKGITPTIKVRRSTLC